jgi:hypothetical protein
MNLLWALIPDEALVLVIAVTGLGLICGIVSRKAAMSVIGGIIAIALLGPFVESVFSALPWWLTTIILLLFLLSLLRGLSNLVLGSRASDHMVGILAADVVRACFGGLFYVFTFPFRLLLWMMRRGY